MSDPGRIRAKTPAKIQRRVFVSGQVQGVGFRAATVRTARQFPALAGFVRNLPDGRVEALFAGDEREVLAMVSWCQHGPSSARVTRLEMREEPFEPQWDGSSFGQSD